MQIILLCIGKSGQKFLEEGESLYLKRLKHYIKTEKQEIPDIKDAKNLSFEEVKVKEGEQLLKQMDQTDLVILLDENGKELSSIQFADQLQRFFNTGPKRILFVVGGPYGFSNEMYTRANGKISLSKMTFSHQMIRVLFLEQLYRGLTILKGEPYHHE